MNFPALHSVPAAAAFLAAGSEPRPTTSGSKNPVMYAGFVLALNTTTQPLREKAYSIMRNLHRGDIYQVRLAPTVFYPSGVPGYVLIMKNDDGSIPCDTADVIFLSPVCNRGKGMILGQGFRPDLGRCVRIPKACLRRRVDSISAKQLRKVDWSFYDRYGCWPTEAVQIP